MVVKRKTTRRTKSLGTRFKNSPVNTTVNEAKKLGIPKPVTKMAIVGIAAGLLTPALATELNRIPLMSVFTGYGATLKRRFSGMSTRRRA